MPNQLAMLIQQRTDAIIGAWAERIYADRRTDLGAILTYGQLVNHLPEVLEELARLLDAPFSNAEALEAARHMRHHALARFQQGCLIDEVARELMMLRDTLNEFLWQEGLSAAEGHIQELRDALRRTDAFVDEMIGQAIVIYAVSLRPAVRTRSSVWPPPRRRKTDYPRRDHER